jgi:hypothetical protein
VIRRDVMGRIAVVLAVLGFGLLASAGATTYLVRPDGTGDFPTIQAAVDAATDGDRILVDDGEYDEDVLIASKYLDLMSQHGLTETTVGSFSFTSDYWSGCGGSVNGFTITGDLDAYSVGNFVLRRSDIFGQAFLLCIQPGMASVDVDSCVFHSALGIWGVTQVHVSECIAPSMGMDARLDATVTHCTVAGGDMYVQGESCGVYACALQNASVRIDSRYVGLAGGNIITGGNLEVHVAPVSTGGASVSGNAIVDGGIAVQGEMGAGAYVTVNTVYGCLGDGIEIELDPTQFVDLSSNIVAACARGIVWVNAPAALDCLCNDVWQNPGGNWIGIPDPTGTNGNISLDPLFCDPAEGDLTLASDSPCLPGNPGNGGCGQIGALGLGCEYASIVPESAGPAALFLARPAPNPFSGETVLSYGIPAANPSTRVRLDVLDPNGRVVRGLVDGVAGPGAYRVRWNGLDDRGAALPCGIYWSRLRVGDRETSERIVRVR